MVVYQQPLTISGLGASIHWLCWIQISPEPRWIMISRLDLSTFQDALVMTCWPKNSVYSPNSLTPHTICFPEAEFWHQKVAQPTHVDNAAEKWVPDTPEPLQGKHKICNNLVLLSLIAKKTNPFQVTLTKRTTQWGFGWLPLLQGTWPSTLSIFQPNFRNSYLTRSHFP